MMRQGTFTEAALAWRDSKFGDARAQGKDPAWGRRSG